MNPVTTQAIWSGVAPGGIAAFEVGFDQARSVEALLGAENLAPARIARDAGGRERVVTACAKPRAT